MSHQSIRLLFHYSSGPLCRTFCPQPGRWAAHLVLVPALVLILTYAFAAPTVADDHQLRCSACKRQITSRHLEYKGRTFCSESCLDTILPRCATCDAVLRESYLTREGQDFCSPRCLENILPQCAVCYRVLAGEYLESDGRKYCGRACLSTTLPPCAICGRRIDSWVEIEEVAYCRECSERDRCFACGHPTGTKEFEDGRLICDTCLGSAILDHGQARRLLNDVRQRMSAELQLATDHRIDLRLVGRRELDRLNPHSGSGKEMGYFYYQGRTTTSFTTKKDGNGRSICRKSGERIKEDFQILVLYGIPEKRLIEVLAHELAHDWAQANLPGMTEAREAEGFAEYVAWLMNVIYGQQQLNRRMEDNPDPVYGKGFRRMKKLADKKGGLFGLISYLSRRYGP